MKANYVTKMEGRVSQGGRREGGGVMREKKRLSKLQRSGFGSGRCWEFSRPSHFPKRREEAN